MGIAHPSAIEDVQKLREQEILNVLMQGGIAPGLISPRDDFPSPYRHHVHGGAKAAGDLFEVVGGIDIAHDHVVSTGAPERIQA